MGTTVKKSTVKKSKWQILVPTTHNDGRPIHTRFHRVWDKKVYEIAGGATILPPAKGRWVCPDGNLFEERMIPVEIVCTYAQIDQIVDMTLEYYKQKAVLACRISDYVILRYAPK